MERIVLWICLLYCAAMAGGALLIYFRSRKRRQPSFFRYQQYFLILVFAFGFYGLWARSFLQIVWLAGSEALDYERLSGFLTLISAPFLIIALVALAAWIYDVAAKPKLLSSAIAFLFSAALISLLYPAWFTNLLTAGAFAVYLFSAFVLFAFRSAFLKTNFRIAVALLLVFSAATYAAHDHIPDQILRLVFVFLFFLFHSGIALITAYALKGYGQTTPAASGDLPGALRSDFGITKREMEVIRGICEGKSNQEIADELFITLQTVKDHAHRIYQKTQVSNRTQLAALVRRYQN